MLMSNLLLHTEEHKKNKKRNDSITAILTKLFLQGNKFLIHSDKIGEKLKMFNRKVFGKGVVNIKDKKSQADVICDLLKKAQNKKEFNEREFIVKCLAENVNCPINKSLKRQLLKAQLDLLNLKKEIFKLKKNICKAIFNFIKGGKK